MTSTAKKRSLTLLILAIVVLGALFLVFRFAYNQQAEVPAEQRVVTVEYTDKGFAPQHVRILPGTKVVWINKASQQNLQVTPNKVADPGTASKDFGSPEAVSNDDTYAHTFGSTGLVTYRNSRAPTHNAQVEIVNQ